MRARWISCLCLVGAAFRAQETSAPGPAASFDFPCAGYAKGLRGAGNFGAYVSAAGSPFRGSYHLAEDVWLQAGTEVRAIADGVVRYSAFSPTWTDERGHLHWNLGNVVVIEHALAPPVDGLEAVCSFYVHLAADRRVAVGDSVTRGQPLGRIGADRSEENGRYPAHLHFGIHRGPYFQVPPALERELRRAAASQTGLAFGELVMRGELEIRRHGDTAIVIRSKDSGKEVVFSLLMGSTAPENPPPDIMNWCEGYGARETLAEWLSPARFLRQHGAR